jgi:hypothetical protein
MQLPTAGFSPQPGTAGAVTTTALIAAGKEIRQSEKEPCGGDQLLGFLDMPTEIQLRVFSRLTPNEISTVGAVCRYWRALSQGTLPMLSAFESGYRGMLTRLSSFIQTRACGETTSTRSTAASRARGPTTATSTSKQRWA